MGRVSEWISRSWSSTATVDREARPDFEADVEVELEPEPEEAPPFRALVVDDNDPMRALVGGETLRHHFDTDLILEASSAAEAMEILEDERVDLVLSDWRMPDLTGLEFLQALRSSGWEGVFGFITAESGPSAVRSALQSGASFIVAKPFRANDLADKIAVAFGGNASVQDEGPKELDRVAKITRLLEGMLGTSVVVTADSEPPKRRDARMATRYVGANGEVSAICVAELAFVIAAGSALALFPVSVAQEWTKSGSLTEDMTRNFHEVANVLSQVAREDGARCAVADLTLYAPSEELEEGDLIRGAADELNLEVSIGAYGTGRLSIADR